MGQALSPGPGTAGKLKQVIRALKNFAMVQIDLWQLILTVLTSGGDLNDSKNILPGGISSALQEIF